MCSAFCRDVDDLNGLFGTPVVARFAVYGKNPGEFGPVG